MVEGIKARIFVAVPLPDEARMALADLVGPLDLPGTVIPPANWHITVRFIGWTDDVGYDCLLASLDQADLGRVFDIEIGEMGAFPRPGSATVLGLGVAKGQTRLEEIAAEVEEAVQAAGFDAEDRPFRPHLTLSRVRPPVDVTGWIDSFPGTGLHWRCRSVMVYRSHLGRGGARYEPLETFPLSR
jgi:2'-5' RNA ligase